MRQKLACAMAFSFGCLFLLTVSPSSQVHGAPVPKELTCIDCKCVKLLEGFVEFTVNPGMWELGTGTGTTDDPFILMPADFGSLKLPTYDPERILISTGYADGGPVSGEISRSNMGTAVTLCELPPGFDPSTSRQRYGAKNFGTPDGTYLPIQKFHCRYIPAHPFSD